MTAESQSTSVARQISVRSVIEVVLRHGPMSRAEMARLTGLSKQTTSDVVRELEQSGLIRIRGLAQGAVGRSATIYELQEETACVLGVDLGGTKASAALANLSGTVVGEITEPTDRRGGHHVVEQVGELADRLLAEAGIERRALRRGVIGSPGVVDPASGAILLAPNISGLDRMDVRAALGARLGIEISVENDVKLAAKGEEWQGNSRGARTFAFIALGTGIGMGIVLDGRLMRGARGAAGEIAYLPLGGDPFDPRGFRFGALETAVGGPAILERYRGYGGCDAGTVREIFDLMAGGDMAAAATIEETARILATAIAAVSAILDPELVVMGGNIGIRPELVDAMRRFQPRCMPTPVRLEISALGSRATLIGAIGVALGQLHHQMFGLAALPGDASPPQAGSASGDTARGDAAEEAGR
jgi:predicted NBD/HSP70 family sugar kinase